MALRRCCDFKPPPSGESRPHHQSAGLWCACLYRHQSKIKGTRHAGPLARGGEILSVHATETDHRRSPTL